MAETTINLKSSLNIVDDRLVAHILIGDQLKEATIDTGASTSFLKESYYRKIKNQCIRTTHQVHIQLADGSTQISKDAVSCCVEFGFRKGYVTFVIMPLAAEDIVLGFNFLRNFGVIISCAGHTTFCKAQSDNNLLTNSSTSNKESLSSTLRKSESISDEELNYPNAKTMKTVKSQNQNITKKDSASANHSMSQDPNNSLKQKETTLIGKSWKIGVKRDLFEKSNTKEMFNEINSSSPLLHNATDETDQDDNVILSQIKSDDNIPIKDLKEVIPIAKQMLEEYKAKLEINKTVTNNEKRYRLTLNSFGNFYIKPLPSSNTEKSENSIVKDSLKTSTNNEKAVKSSFVAKNKGEKIHKEKDVVTQNYKGLEAPRPQEFKKTESNSLNKSKSEDQKYKEFREKYLKNHNEIEEKIREEYRKKESENHTYNQRAQEKRFSNDYRNNDYRNESYNNMYNKNNNRERERYEENRYNRNSRYQEKSRGNREDEYRKRESEQNRSNEYHRGDADSVGYKNSEITNVISNLQMASDSELMARIHCTDVPIEDLVFAIPEARKMIELHPKLKRMKRIVLSPTARYRLCLNRKAEFYMKFLDRLSTERTDDEPPPPGVTPNPQMLPRNNQQYNMECPPNVHETQTNSDQSLTFQFRNYSQHNSNNVQNPPNNNTKDFYDDNWIINQFQRNNVSEDIISEVLPIAREMLEAYPQQQTKTLLMRDGQLYRLNLSEGNQFNFQLLPPIQPSVVDMDIEPITIADDDDSDSSCKIISSPNIYERRSTEEYERAKNRHTSAPSSSEMLSSSPSSPRFTYAIPSLSRHTPIDETVASSGIAFKRRSTEEYERAKKRLSTLSVFSPMSDDDEKMDLFKNNTYLSPMMIASDDDTRNDEIKEKLNKPLNKFSDEDIISLIEAPNIPKQLLRYIIPQARQMLEIHQIHPHTQHQLVVIDEQRYRLILNKQRRFLFIKVSNE